MFIVCVRCLLLTYIHSLGLKIYQVFTRSSQLKRGLELKLALRFNIGVAGSFRWAWQGSCVWVWHRTALCGCGTGQLYVGVTQDTLMWVWHRTALCGCGRVVFMWVWQGWCYHINPLWLLVNYHLRIANPAVCN